MTHARRCVLFFWVTLAPAAPSAAQTPAFVELCGEDSLTCAIAEDRSVWCWGEHSDGRPRRVEGLSEVRQLECLGGSVRALDPEGVVRHVVLLGRADLLAPREVARGATRIGSIYVRFEDGSVRSAFAVDPQLGSRRGTQFLGPAGRPLGDDRVTCWDRADGGVQCGERLRGVPSGVRGVVSGGRARCGTRPNGRVTCWGAHPADYDRTAPYSVPGITGVVELTANHNEAFCARTRRGQVHCWGGNFGGVIAEVATETVWPPRRLPELDGARDIAFLGGRMCAVIVDGGVRCQGAVVRSQPTPIDSLPPIRQMVGLRAGPRMAAVSTDDELWLWGRWTWRGVRSITPIRFAEGVARIDDGGSLCVTYRNGRAECEQGHRIDRSDVAQATTNISASCVRTRGGEVWCTGEPRRGGLNPNGWARVPGLEQVESLVRTGSGFCALAERRVSCWGRPLELFASAESNGEQGFGRRTIPGRFTGIVGENGRLVALDTRGRVETFATGEYVRGPRVPRPELGVVRSLDRAAVVRADGSAAIVNPYSDQQEAPTLVPAPGGTRSVVRSGTLWCALDDHAQVSCWGSSPYFGLSHGAGELGPAFDGP